MYYLFVTSWWVFETSFNTLTEDYDYVHHPSLTGSMDIGLVTLDTYNRIYRFLEPFTLILILGTLLL